MADACRRAGAAQVLAVAADVTRPAALRRAAALAQKKLGGLDVAYVNAGYSLAGPLATMPLASWRRQMQVNVEGALNTIQACLPLLARSRGRLGVVGSVVSYGSLSHSGAYAASKGALRSLAQVLALETAPLGVSVTFIAPGFFASELRLKDAHGRPQARGPRIHAGLAAGRNGRAGPALPAGRGGPPAGNWCGRCTPSWRSFFCATPRAWPSPCSSA